MSRPLLIFVFLFFALAPAFAKKTQSGRTTANPPEVQRAGFRVPEGFVIELVASEANGVINPIDLTFDDAGRLWTQTASMYPLDPVKDIKWGHLIRLMNDPAAQARDPEFKRIRNLYQLKTIGRDKILILQDPSRPAKGPLRVWADGLSLPQSILPYQNGAYVCHGSELFFLADTIGDGRADTMTPVLTDFGITDTHTMAHLLVRAPGAWIHFSQGALNKGKVTALASGQQLRVDAACQVRFSLDHQQCEVVSTGPSNMWGLQLRANGQWYGTEANDVGMSIVPFEHGTGLSGVAGPRLRDYQPFLPPPHKFRVGGTGISGLAFMEDREGSFPFETWKDVALLANPITSTINAVRIRRLPSGAVEAEHLPDFLTSGDDWFRPVNLEFGPDGCLYVADWYNKIISHNEVGTTHPDRDRSHGRIWRIRHESQVPRKVPNIAKTPTAKLPDLLRSPVLWEKRAAWHQIVDRRAVGVADRVAVIVRDEGATIPTRIHALWTLEGLGRAGAEEIRPLLVAPDADLRREAVRALASSEVPPAELAGLLAPLIEDAHCMVRSQVLRTLRDRGEADGNTIDLLVRACKPVLPGKGLGGPYERSFERFLARYALEGMTDQLRAYLSSSAAASQPPPHLLWAIQALPVNERTPAFLGLWNAEDGLEGERFVSAVQLLHDPKVFSALQPVFDAPANAISLVRQALVYQSRVQSPELTRLLKPAVRTLLGRSPDRELALDAMVRFGMVELADGLEGVTVPAGNIGLRTRLIEAQALRPKTYIPAFENLFDRETEPFELRLAALHALAVGDAKRALPRTAAWISSATPAEQSRIVDRLSQSQPGSGLLLELVRAGKLDDTDVPLSAAERMRAAAPGDKAAQSLFGRVQQRVAQAKAQVHDRIAGYREATGRLAGDATRGKALFQACLSCHRVGDQGQNIAPPLDGSAHRELDHLLTAIVDPGAAVEGGYGLFRVTRNDGSSVEGYLVGQRETGSTVAVMGGVEIFTPRSNIKGEQFVAGRSFMPDSFGHLPEQDMVDLIRYIQTLK